VLERLPTICWLLRPWSGLVVTELPEAEVSRELWQALEPDRGPGGSRPEAAGALAEKILQPGGSRWPEDLPAPGFCRIRGRIYQENLKEKQTMKIRFCNSFTHPGGLGAEL